jgi:hypothetical protein
LVARVGLAARSGHGFKSVPWRANGLSYALAGDVLRRAHAVRPYP